MKKAKPDPLQGSCCGVCKFWNEQTDPTDDVRWGLCRRYPPSPRIGTDADTGDEVLEQVWPPTDLDEYCGEYRGNQ